MKKILLTCIIVVHTAFQVNACTCDYRGDFLAVAPKAKLVAFVKVIGYPALIRPSFTLGGSGGGIA
ncbi:MAG: hypothetical protein H7Z75_20980, partial [Ferruginibacter sp.]|nr:hypothetical protein [Cytophagales bacterium]